MFHFLIQGKTSRNSLREKCPYSEFCGPYSVPMWKNTVQKNSEYGHISRIDLLVQSINGDTKAKGKSVQS